MFYYNLEESGKRLKELREGKKYTQQNVADYLGISKDGYRQLEYGRNGASVDVLILLALYLDSTVDYIVTGRECIVVNKSTEE